MNADKTRHGGNHQTRSEGDKFTGSFSVEGYDLDGSHMFHQEGDVSGERINAMDPLPDAGPMPMMRLGPCATKNK